MTYRSILLTCVLALCGPARAALEPEEAALLASLGHSQSLDAAAALTAVHRDLDELKAARARGFANPRAEERAARLDDLLHDRVGPSPEAASRPPVAVWVTRYGGAPGARYHVDDCPDMRGIASRVALKQVPASMTPCATCLSPQGLPRRLGKRVAQPTQLTIAGPSQEALAAVDQVIANGRKAKVAADKAYWAASAKQQLEDEAQALATNVAAPVPQEPAQATGAPARAARAAPAAAPADAQATGG